MSNMNAEQMALARSLPHPDAVTGQQIDNLLRIAGTLLGIVCAGEREENIPGKNSPDGSVKTSAEATFINVCNRLDAIVNDPQRFNLDFQKSLEQRAGEIQNYNIELLKNQAAAAAEMKTPHFRFRPHLRRAPGTPGWIAILGDDPDNAIAGMGHTPEAAVKAFDQIFLGALPIEMLQWLIAHEAAMNAGQVSPPFPKTQNTNETKPVVRTGNKTNRRSKKRRANPETDGDGSGEIAGLS